MNTWISDSRRPALSAEEGALLPALPRRMMTKGAALKTALGAARRLERMQVSEPVSLHSPVREKRAVTRPIRENRAALHQVTRRSRRGETGIGKGGR